MIRSEYAANQALSQTAPSNVPKGWLPTPAELARAAQRKTKMSFDYGLPPGFVETLDE
jgi:hypothetical protein